MSYRIKLATNEATSLSSVVTKAGNERHRFIHILMQVASIRLLY